MLVREIMTPRPRTVRPATEVVEALRLLDRHGVTAMPVVDADGRLRGIVSEVDLIRDRVPADPRARLRPAARVSYPAERVEDLMTTAVVTVGPDDDVRAAIDVITSTGVKSLPVVADDHWVVGILSRSDIVHAVARSDDGLERAVAEALRECGLAGWVVDAHGGLVNLMGPATSPDAVAAEVVARAVPGVTGVHLARPGPPAGGRVS